MQSKIVPLDSNIHKNIKIQADKFYSHIQQQNIIPILAFEFLKASSDYPIFFIKQEDTGRFKSVALMGLTENENLVFTEGKVNADYIPANIQRYPFAVGKDENKEQEMMLCIDEHSPLLSKEHGTILFNEDGSPSELTEKISTKLTDLVAKEEATDIFIDFLVEHDLIQSLDLKLSLGAQGTKKINGLYKIDEEALHALDDETALTVFKRKYFPAIYAHLSSLSQVNRLLKLKANFES
ncbi:SapC family protein [Colwelliaceae bacterium MEBiC 14330]